ncbi:DUF1360 domain-containing protein [Bacillus sp. FJAT-45037]|uniref:DUF1360 domain-containing protein n=1 Tax=Bacillus sp. FJAT-45037 TaxID=2011007 RepID=UPI001E2A3666|nr:DUF1360 domain-containing protein [Bacillus sp. FJAT-45037]
MELISLSVFEFVLLSIATFRLTHLLVFDEIAEFMRRPFQNVTEEVDENGDVYQYVSGRGNGIRKFIGDMLSCYWCSGIWASLILFVGITYLGSVTLPVVCVLAIAGVAAIIETVVRKLNK